MNTHNTHELKIWPEYFELVATGKKLFELRRDDRGFKTGDVLLMREWNQREGEYTGRTITKRVTYLLGAGRVGGLVCGYVCMALGELVP